MECWMHVEWTACGTPDYKSPGSAGRFLPKCHCSLLSITLIWLISELRVIDWTMHPLGGGGVGHVEHYSNVYSLLKQFWSNSLRHISATNNRKMEHLVWRLSSIYSNEWPVFNSGQMRSSASLNKQEEKPFNTWERGVNKQKPFRKWTETRLTYPKQKWKKGKKKETTYWGNIQQLWLHLFSITAIQKDSQALLFLVLGS